MFLESYCNVSGNKISFTRQQGSDFAKKVADDFNPLHDTDAKRFCIPGDLLFSLVLEKSGLSQEMKFTFSGMVSEGIELIFPMEINGQSAVVDSNNKEYLVIAASGQQTKKSETITSLTKAYVEFSGQTFPHILVALMAENNVMINPARPMVMYESMTIHLDKIDFTTVQLELAQSTLSIDGKRGVADLIFNLISEGKKIGYGKKHMLLSGLRPYEQATIDGIVDVYNDKKTQYHR
ncbi:hypothetical protein tinsulaeT_24480 [Thalassotalea insulae]|uniref:DUF3581 family protein n=1 Tax=Thalassotalea insulae TaxID=2056778 RepID=A0ABQ6GT59_9GAMM|nr:DUF3581 family protein [Thalassotalea insulae]GLX79108.1 hypothetical protein tinsulaeT_24480 [Thalassotalea insulae]